MFGWCILPKYNELQWLCVYSSCKPKKIYDTRRWLGIFRLALCLSHIRPRAPYDFQLPFDFLPVRPGESPVGILRRCCSGGHIRLRAPYSTAWHGCALMVWSINSQDSTGTPCDARVGISWAPYENLQCFSYPTGPVRGPCAGVP